MIVSSVKVKLDQRKTYVSIKSISACSCFSGSQFRVAFCNRLFDEKRLDKRILLASLRQYVVEPITTLYYASAQNAFMKGENASTFSTFFSRTHVLCFFILALRTAGSAIYFDSPLVWLRVK